MRRRWWERVTEPIRGAGGYAITGEHLQHVRDAFAFVERTVQRTANPSEYNEAKEILDRGAPPEPEWRKGPPDRVGAWQRRTAAVYHHGPRPTTPPGPPEDVYVKARGLSLNRHLAMQYGEYGTGQFVAPVEDINHDGYEYRRIGD